MMRPKILLLATMLVLLGAVMVAGCRRNAPVLRWQEAAAGMEIGQYGDANDPDQLHFTAVRVDPARCTIRVVDAHHGRDGEGARAVDICPQTGAAINGSFFAEDRTPLGLLIVNGKRIQRRFPRLQWGTFRVRRGRPEIVQSTSAPAAGVSQALESKPRLIVQGRIPTFKPQGAARRSAVGLDGQGYLILAVTDDYLTLEQWAAVLHHQLGCIDALNLDGGPSTQLATRGQVAITVTGGWPVPVFLVAVPRNEE